MTPDQFAEKIKAKYPAYKDMDNLELATKIVNKYPQYESQVKLPSTQTETPGIGERVSGIVSQAGQTISEQIAGEGEFEGQSAITRGTGAVATAATAIPGTLIQAVPEPLGGGLLRSGLEKVGGALQKGFGKITGALAETDLIKGAAGRMDVDPNTGVATYTPNDLGYLEEALQTASNIGDTADVVLGAGLGPKAVAKTTTKTAAAIKDVATEALDRSVRATSNLAEKATPQSVRTMLRLSPPENRKQAVDSLEDAYKTGLVEDRKSINNKLDKLAASNSFGDTKVTRDSLIRELAEEGYVPKIEGQFAKFDDVFDNIDDRQRGLMESLDAELAPISNRIETQTSLDRMRAEAEAILRQSPQVSAGLTSSLNELNRMFASFAEKYGNIVNPIQVSDIRKEMNRVTKAYKEQGGDSIYQLDAADAVAKATRSRLDEVVPTGKVRDLNAEWARLQRVRDTAKLLHNETVEVGLLGRKLGSYVGTIGASLVGLQIAGPGGLVAASLFAQLGGDALATFLRSKKFSPELREIILKDIKESPDVAEKLIREASPENKAYLAKVLAVGATAATADFFVGDEGTAAALLIGSTGGKTKITGRALDRIEQYIDHVEGVKKVSGQELVDLKADAQIIAEGANLDKKYLTGGDKTLASGLRKALDKQNFER